MRVLLFGASGRIGQRLANELLDRTHQVTGVSRSGDIDVHHPGFEAVVGDATDVDDVAHLASGYDAVASALGPGSDPDVLTDMVEAVIEGVRRADVSRLVWTGGAGGLYVESGTRLVETDDFPEEVVPLAQAHIDALDSIRKPDDIEWSYIAPPVTIEPGERTGEYRTAQGELVVDRTGKSHVSMEDFAVAFVDELETGNAIRTQLGIGY